MKRQTNPYPGGPEYSLNITKQTNTKGLKVMTTRETPTTHNLGKLICFHCSKCGRNIVNCYETDPKGNGGIDRDLHYCSKCGNPIDFGEFYHNPKQHSPSKQHSSYTQHSLLTADDNIKFED